MGDYEGVLKSDNLSGKGAITGMMSLAVNLLHGWTPLAEGRHTVRDFPHAILETRHLKTAGGMPLLLPPSQGILIHGGTGRFGWCFAQWALRAARERGDHTAVFAIPGSVEGWYLASQGKSPHLPTIENINRGGDILFLPPRDVVAQLDVAQARSRSAASVWDPAYVWARAQLDARPDLADVTRALERSAEFQVIATKLGMMRAVFDKPFIDGLPPDATLLHASKSIAPGGLFGAEVGWEEFRARSREDLAQRWVSSEGYATEHEVVADEECRLKFTALAEDAVATALAVFSGNGLKLTTAHGRDAVLSGQWINAGKNWAALGTGEAAARLAFGRGRGRGTMELGREFEQYRQTLWSGLQTLAGLDLGRSNGRNSPEGEEDFVNCTTVAWREIFELPMIGEAMALSERKEPVDFDEMRNRLIAFRRIANPKYFGTTNSTFGIVFAMARMMRARRMIDDVLALMSGQPIPEGIPALKFVRERASLQGQEFPLPLKTLMRHFDPICAAFVA